MPRHLSNEKAQHRARVALHPKDPTQWMNHTIPKDSVRKVANKLLTTRKHITRALYIHPTLLLPLTQPYDAIGQIISALRARDDIQHPDLATPAGWRAQPITPLIKPVPPDSPLHNRQLYPPSETPRSALTMQARTFGVPQSGVEGAAYALMPALALLRVAADLTNDFDPALITTMHTIYTTLAGIVTRLKPQWATPPFDIQRTPPKPITAPPSEFDKYMQQRHRYEERVDWHNKQRIKRGNQAKIKGER